MSEFKVRQYPAFAATDLEIIDKSTVFQGFFRIERWQLRHKCFAGGWSEVMTREIFERGQAVVVLPYNAGTDEIVLSKFFTLTVVRSMLTTSPSTPNFSNVIQSPFLTRSYKTI